MSDDDYEPSMYAARPGAWNLRDALAGKYERKAVSEDRPVVFRGGLELRSVWDGWEEARHSPDRPPTRFRYVMTVIQATYPDLARASRLDPADYHTGVNHTSVLRLAKKGSIPYRKAACVRQMIDYINRTLEIAGYAPVTTRELFPRYDHYWGCSKSRYERFVAEVGL